MCLRRRLDSAPRFVLIHAGCCWLLLGSVAATAGAPVAPRRPFPQHVPYVADTILPTHRTRTQLDADVVAAWTQWKARHLASAGTEPDSRPRYRVKAIAPDGKTVSEAQGYGMLLAAYMAGADPNARTTFDGLFEFSADHPSLVDTRLFDWIVPPNEAPAADPTEDDSAFDGDADIAYALLLADRQWGSDTGVIDYRSRALSVIAGILDSEIGPASRLPLLGDWIDLADPLQNQWTPRTSDFMPGHFRVFGEVTGVPAWEQVRTAVLAAARSLRENFAPMTGLLPDFTRPTSAIDHTLRPAVPNFLESENDGAYYLNAGRVPWRLAVDALHSGDATAWDGALAIAFWAEAELTGNPALFTDGYTLAGVPLGTDNEAIPFFAAPIGVASMLDAELQTWLEAIYEAVRQSNHGYYADSVALLSMVVMTGNWWEPLPVPEPSAFAQGVAMLVAVASLRRARC